MEKNKLSENWEVIKRGRWRPRKIRTDEELLQNLKTKEAPIPDWKTLNIKDVVKFKEEWKFEMKDIKENKKWEKYVVIKWRKYYEYLWWAERPDSFYSMKWNTLFIWDKVEWANFWDWIYINSSTYMQGSVYIEERKAKYSEINKAIHLWALLKNRSYTLSETLTTIQRNWKMVKITKEMVDRYCNWSASKTEELCINYAKKTNPEFFAYMEDRMW